MNPVYSPDELDQGDDLITDGDSSESLLDEALTETFSASDPIAVTFATGLYQSDLLSYAARLDEVY